MSVLCIKVVKLLIKINKNFYYDLENLLMIYLLSGINCYRLYQHVNYQLRHKRGTYTYLT